MALASAALAPDPTSASLSRLALPAPWIGFAFGTALVGLALVAGLQARTRALEGDARAAAERARSEGDAAGEAVALGRVLRANPASAPSREGASSELGALATRLEVANDAGGARAAWRELRSGWYAIGAATGAAGGEWVARAEAGLVRTGAEREALSRPDASAATVPSMVAPVALVLWAGAVVGLLNRGLDATGRVVHGAAGRWLVGAAAAFVLWAAALLAA